MPLIKNTAEPSIVEYVYLLTCVRSFPWIFSNIQFEYSKTFIVQIPSHMEIR